MATLRNQQADMIGFEDATKSIDEAEKANMRFRTKPSIKSAIEKAATISSVDASVYAMKAALETIDAHERTILQLCDYEAVFSALDNPPKPTRALRDAHLRYCKRVVSR